MLRIKPVGKAVFFDMIIVFLVLVLFMGNAVSFDKEEGEAFLANLVFKLFKCDHRKNLYLDISEIKIYFYDFQYRKTKPKIFKISQASERILSQPYFDNTKKIYVYVGGFTSEITSNSTVDMRKAFERVPHSYFIIVDFLPYANNKPGEKTGYELAVRHAYYVGVEIAWLLARIVYQGGITPKNIHGIGYSLGCHILGYVGDIFIKITGRKLGRITALDPAGPCYSGSLLQEQIRSGVADYVEIYHCNFGGLGTSNILGDIDFFVNKGTSQPDCVEENGYFLSIVNYAVFAACNHRVCLGLWASSVAYPDRFVAYKCDSYEHFSKGNCSTNKKTIAGFRNPGTATGIHYISTEGFSFND